ncbi:hypothetical protein E2562_024423 [Oryza meyeriana var. granulata]|uniref:Uncharacterized protein n=1 Tax=Oryza meyeriana var. granulata TaxID=110450 RepID=A0A6G1EYP3_9ORYZ|nr:hypothetical protein E2562_024423 [Oryza meyeriana var. granulata]
MGPTDGDARLGSSGSSRGRRVEAAGTVATADAVRGWGRPTATLGSAAAAAAKEDEERRQGAFCMYFKAMEAQAP